MGAKSFTEFEVWQSAHRVALATYKVTREFPSDERFGLTSQMRRAAVSVAANIAEGFGRRLPGDKCRFYNISQGSLEEYRYYLILAGDLGYPAFGEEVHRCVKLVGGKLNNLIASVSRADAAP
jgi:four helix bundle protein